MALIKCPECKHEVSDKASMCPHCGYPLQGSASFSDAEKPVAPTKKKTNKARAAITAVIVSLVIIALAGAGVWWVFLRPGNDGDERSMYESIMRCEQQNNLDSLELCLDEYFDTYNSDARYYSQLKELHDRFSAEHADWKSTERIASTEAINKFLDAHPDGFYRERAYIKLDSLSFAEAVEADTQEAYESYMNHFVDGKYVEQAQEKLAEIEKRKLTEDEKDSVEHIIERHFDALAAGNKSALELTISHNISSYLNKSNPTIDDIFAFMDKIHKSDRTLEFDVDNEQVAKIVTGDKVEYNVTFTLEEKIYTRSLLSFLGVDDELSEVKSLKGKAVVNESMKITSLKLNK